MITKRQWKLFSRKLDKSGSCWLWTGVVSSNGYGVIQRNGKVIYVHRYSYTYYKGDIPPRYVIDHLCRVPLCVNPKHLEAVTIGENVLRGVGAAARNKLKTECPQGHSYTEDGDVYTSKRGRVCRICRNVSLRKTRVKGNPRKLPTAPLAIHCSRGHKYDWVYWRKDGYPQQVCKQCQRAKSQAFRARQRLSQT